MFGKKEEAINMMPNLDILKNEEKTEVIVENSEKSDYEIEVRIITDKFKDFLGLAEKIKSMQEDNENLQVLQCKFNVK